MKIFNQDKTRELAESEIDYEKGHLVADKLFIAHHDAVPFRAGKSAETLAAEKREAGIKVMELKGKLYAVDKEYANGGRSVTEIVAEPDSEAVNAYDEYEDVRVYIPYTEAELQERANKKRHVELKTELEKVKEDIEQVQYGLIRDDYEVKKARACEIINELRVLEGKLPRDVL